MISRRGFLATTGAAALAGCDSGKPRIRRYSGPEVTRIQVQKADRRMYLLHHDTILKAYDIELGFAPVGPKQFEGDGKTPEGRYVIDRRNPRSSFYLSIGISYPNVDDVARAAALGKKPGGDIFIHGRADRFGPRSPDWTAGCISVTNREMEDIYAMVNLGTVIDLLA